MGPFFVLFPSCQNFMAPILILFLFPELLLAKPMKNIDPTKTTAWKDLAKLYQNKLDLTIQSLFKDQERFKKYSVRWEDILVDFSKNKVDEEIFSTLLSLADETGLKEAIESMFSGVAINQTEDR